MRKDFDIRVLSAFLGQDFHTEIVVLVPAGERLVIHDRHSPVRTASHVIAVNFAEKDYCGRARCQRFDGHLKFGRIDRLESDRGLGLRRKQNADENGKSRKGKSTMSGHATPLPAHERFVRAGSDLYVNKTVLRNTHGLGKEADGQI